MSLLVVKHFGSCFVHSGQTCDFLLFCSSDSVRVLVTTAATAAGPDERRGFMGGGDDLARRLLALLVDTHRDSDTERVP